MRTSQAISPLTAQQVGISLMTFVVVYFLVFGTGVYYMLKIMNAGPKSTQADDDERAAKTGGRRTVPAAA
jgi:cytochrome d ubiquinol oxidase subunit I